MEHNPDQMFLDGLSLFFFHAKNQKESGLPELCNFQKAMMLETINTETLSIDRKARMFWEHPLLDKKIDKLLEALSNSG